MEDSAVLEAEKTDEPEQKSVSSDLIRGHINTIILRALYDGDKYGYEIIAEIEHKSHGQYSLKQPSLYSALKRLEKDGYVTSYWGGSVGGGRRKYFSLTEAGKAVSEQNQSEWEYSRTVIDSLISDKDFDFSNPAPTSVNMRMLQKTTSRVPRGEGGEDDLDYEPSFEDAEELAKLEARYREQLRALDERGEELTRREEAFEESMRTRTDAMEKEHGWREREIAAREQALAQRRAELDELRARQNAEQEQALGAQTEQLQNRIASLEYELRESEAALEQLRRENDAQAETDRIRTEEVLESERRAYDEKLAQALEEERARHAEELKAQETRILSEQEEIFRKREQQLLHRNYLELVNAPPAEEEPRDYDYHTPPVPEDTPSPAAEDYRTVVHRLYANAVSGETSPVREENATSLDGIDFTDLEARAAQDGIRIRTAGSVKAHAEEPTESLVHKGKALFLSGIAVFLFCVALGSIILGLSSGAHLPAFFPYLIWGIGLAVLLVTGLAYANRYGERALRRTGPVILNVVVGYLLLVIVTLIVALSCRADLNDPVQISCWVTIPVIAYLGVILFGVVYYLQVRPKNKKS